MIAQIAIAILSVAALFGMAFIVRRAGVQWSIGAETQRKLVHVGVGIHAMLLPFLLDRSGFLVFVVLAGFALLVLRLPNIARSGDRRFNSFCRAAILGGHPLSNCRNRLVLARRRKPRTLHSADRGAYPVGCRRRARWHRIWPASLRQRRSDEKYRRHYRFFRGDVDYRCRDPHC